MDGGRSWEPVIGLEVHAQLLTQTKIFCGCASTFGSEPNTNVCPVCLGLPGALPVLNGKAVEMAVRTALALECTVHSRSVFARKSYFYPDLPKGYQISQFDLPFATDGQLEIEPEGAAPRRVGITRIHMEEDAGKNLHGIAFAPGTSVVDLNRAGTPLIEIVGAPDLRGADEAVAYLKKLRNVLIALSVNDGNLEEGSFRCDVNVSVRRRGAEAFGTRVEIKNVNSFRHVHRAIEFEIARLVALAERGETFRQHTRKWDDAGARTVFLREKEGSDDYRYFPDPDLPPLILDPSWVRALAETLPELPGAKRARLVVTGISAADATTLTSHPRLSEYFDELCRARPDDSSFAKRAANFVLNELLAEARTDGLAMTFPLSTKQTLELLGLVDAGTISGKQAKDVYSAVKSTPLSPAEWVSQHGIEQVSDEGALLHLCTSTIAGYPKQVASYRAGKKGTLGFFVGQVMKETKGSANPALVSELLTRLLDAEP